jgi:hypothetical protein
MTTDVSTDLALRRGLLILPLAVLQGLRGALRGLGALGFVVALALLRLLGGACGGAVVVMQSALRE